MADRAPDPADFEAVHGDCGDLPAHLVPATRVDRPATRRFLPWEEAVEWTFTEPLTAPTEGAA